MNWFNIQHLDGVAYARIFDEIGAFGKYAAEFIDTLGDAQRVELRIDSPGGCGLVALEIYEALCKRHTKTVITGRCYSAAAIIAMAGRHVTMHRGSQLLLHPSRSCVFGNKLQLRERADELEKIESRILDLVCKKTSKPPVIVAFALAQESWFDSDSALEFGLVDEIINPSLLPVLQRSPEQIPNPPETDDERLFEDMLRAFEPLTVCDKNRFMQRLEQWAIHKVIST